MMQRDSAAAPTSVSARLSAQRRIPLETISRLNRDLISALTHGGSHWPKAAPSREELEEEGTTALSRRRLGASEPAPAGGGDQSVKTISSAAREPTSAPP